MELPRRRNADPQVREIMTGAGSGERLLAWGRLRDGGVVVCTLVALHAPAFGRVPWDRVERAAWSDGVLEVVIKSPAGHQVARLDFAETGQVPTVVRERVQWSVLASQHVILARPEGPSGGAQISARRSPETGEVTWGVVFDPGLDAQDPEWRRAADEAVAALRASLGV
jgi:hypothetical protein